MLGQARGWKARLPCANLPQNEAFDQKSAGEEAMIARSDLGQGLRRSNARQSLACQTSLSRKILEDAAGLLAWKMKEREKWQKFF